MVRCRLQKGNPCARICHHARCTIAYRVLLLAVDIEKLRRYNRLITFMAHINIDEEALLQQLQAPPGPILRLLSKDDVMLQPVRRACALLFLCQNAHGPLPSVALHLLNLFTFIQGLGVVVRHQHRIQNVVCHLLLVRSSSCSAPSILWVRIDLYHLIHHRLPAAGPATFTHILSAPFPNSLN